MKALRDRKPKGDTMIDLRGFGPIRGKCPFWLPATEQRHCEMELREPRAIEATSSKVAPAIDVVRKRIRQIRDRNEVIGEQNTKATRFRGACTRMVAADPTVRLLARQILPYSYSVRRS